MGGVHFNFPEYDDLFDVYSHRGNIRNGHYAYNSTDSFGNRRDINSGSDNIPSCCGRVQVSPLLYIADREWTLSDWSPTCSTRCDEQNTLCVPLHGSRRLQVVQFSRWRLWVEQQEERWSQFSFLHVHARLSVLRTTSVYIIKLLKLYLYSLYERKYHTCQWWNAPQFTRNVSVYLTQYNFLVLSSDLYVWQDRQDAFNPLQPCLGTSDKFKNVMNF